MVAASSRRARGSRSKHVCWPCGQGGVVGDAEDTHGAAQFVMLAQERGEAAVIGLEEDLEDQADKQLRLGV